MGIWNSTLVYVGARTLLAGAMIALLLRRRVGAFYAGGQVVSDLACAAFLLAYVNPAIRDDIGVLVIPLVLFVLYWETMRFFENRQAAAMREDEDSWIDTSLRVYGMLWTWGFVLPAILSGAFLMFDLMAPNEWPFPNPKAPLTCTPQQLRFGGELTLDLRVPHGTPTGRLHSRRSRGCAHPYGVRPFANVAHLTLATDTLTHVFADSGVYAVTISTEGELSASLMCRVRYGT